MDTKNYKPTLMGVMKKNMDNLTIGEEWSFSTENLNFGSLLSTFQKVKKKDWAMMQKSFSGRFSTDYSTYSIKRIS